MSTILSGPRHLAATLLLAALPVAALAQNSVQDSLLRSGNLVGGRPRPAASRATASRPTAEAAIAANADPTLGKLLRESIDVNRVPAADLSDLYTRFMDAVRAERRQWSARDWAAASTTLTRLNQRYELVRKRLPLSDRMNVRACQGDFRTLEAAATRL